MIVLAGDIGGTNARLALVDLAGDLARIVARQQVQVADHTGLVEPVRAFLAAEGRTPRLACLAIAGTIDGRRIQGVNLPWAIDADELEAECGLERVVLINDFHAAARGVELLGADDRLRIGGGEPNPEGPIAVLGAGTGLGQAFLLPTPAGPRRVVSTEGGHRDFGPTSPEQDRLLAYLRDSYGRVSTERVLSGPGLEAIYRFLLVEGRAPCQEVEEAAGHTARTRAISSAGLAGAHPTCADAVRIFVEVYGAEAGNVALTVLATGGVYLAGGIAPALFEHEAQIKAFWTAFSDKGRFREYVGSLPVWVVLSGDLGLLGAAREAALA